MRVWSSLSLGHPQSDARADALLGTTEREDTVGAVLFVGGRDKRQG